MLLAEKQKGVVCDIIHVMSEYNIIEQLIEHGQVDQNGYKLELCTYGHHWYQRCVRKEQAIACHTLGYPCPQALLYTDKCLITTTCAFTSCTMKTW